MSRRSLELQMRMPSKCHYKDHINTVVIRTHRRKNRCAPRHLRAYERYISIIIVTLMVFIEVVLLVLV